MPDPNRQDAAQNPGWFWTHRIALAYISFVLMVVIAMMGCRLYKERELKAERNVHHHLIMSMNRVANTSYDHLQAIYFPAEYIDFDMDGKCRMESCSFDIQDNQPFEGIKTVRIEASWPQVRSANRKNQNLPATETAHVIMMINKPGVESSVFPIWDGDISKGGHNESSACF